MLKLLLSQAGVVWLGVPYASQQLPSRLPGWYLLPTVSDSPHKHGPACCKIPVIGCAVKSMTCHMYVASGVGPAGWSIACAGTSTLQPTGNIKYQLLFAAVWLG